MTNPADMVRIADTTDDFMRLRASLLVNNVAAAQNALTRWKAPRLGARFADDAHLYDHPADAGTILVCPWCGKNATLYVVDRDERHTIAEDIDLATEVVSFTYDGHGNQSGWQTSHYSTECCKLPVSLPEGWEEV